jgi:hypothetical protein
MTGEEQQMQRRKLLQASNLSQQIRGPLSKGTWFDNKEKAKEEGIETAPPPSIMNEVKIRHADFKHFWGTIYSAASGKNARSSIYARNHITLPLL